MITITEQKPVEEVLENLKSCRKVYIIGCGTCATMLHTGGKTEVIEMKDKLEAEGKEVTGWMVIPTACDPLTKEALLENARDVDRADCILVMSCAFGVQTVGLYNDKAVYPALDTLFLGKETRPGYFVEVCQQCGQCVLGQYAGICPMTQCAKSLLNGPCGGASNGKCEQKPEYDCAWVLIYDRLKKLGRIDEMKEYVGPTDYSKMNKQRHVEVTPLD